MARFGIFALILITLLSASVRGEVLFSVDFENGLKATGTNGGEPIGSIGGGFEVLKEGSEKLLGASVTDAFSAQGKYCLQLGHNIVWKVGINDRSPGQLSFWMLPVILPSDGEREIVWGGDNSKPHQTFWMKLHPDGKISANYWSFQKQNWLSGVTEQLKGFVFEQMLYGSDVKTGEAHEGDYVIVFSNFAKKVVVAWSTRLPHLASIGVPGMPEKILDMLGYSKKFSKEDYKDKSLKIELTSEPIIYFL